MPQTSPIPPVIPVPYVLNLWEIAHRWHGLAPDADPSRIPPPVQDALRFLTEKAYRHELALCDENGVVFGNDQTTVDLEFFIPSWMNEPLRLWPTDPEEREKAARDLAQKVEEQAPAGIDADEARYEEWRQHYETRTRRHNEAVAQFEACFRRSQFDRELLTQRYTTQTAFRALLEQEGLPFPEFWKTEYELAEPTEIKDDERNEDTRPPRASQIDKERVQAIALTLWDIDPNLTITALTKHPAILRYGNGKHYNIKTLRQWITEVDPRPPEKKRGRPKKS